MCGRSARGANGPRTLLVYTHVFIARLALPSLALPRPPPPSGSQPSSRGAGREGFLGRGASGRRAGSEEAFTTFLEIPSRAGNAAGGGMGTKQYGGTARSAEGAAGEEEAAAAPPRSQGRISHRLSVEP